MLNSCILRRAEAYRQASDKGRNLSMSYIRLKNNGMENEPKDYIGYILSVIWGDPQERVIQAVPGTANKEKAVARLC